MACKKIKVYGIVQNVGYRFWAKRLATSLNVTGYVRNMPDGSVELVVCGAGNLLTVMFNACKKGPAQSVVKNVVEEDIEFDPVEEFKIWV